MDTLSLEQRIVKAARSWRGTRFAHQGRRKASAGDAGAVDCLGLLAGVAQELALMGRDGTSLHTHDVLSYSKSPDGWLLKERLSALLCEVSTPHAGCVALFMLDAMPQHLAILSDYAPGGVMGMIHAYAPARAVVEHRLDDLWQKNIVSLYTCAYPPLPSPSRERVG